MHTPVVHPRHCEGQQSRQLAAISTELCTADTLNGNKRISGPNQDALLSHGARHTQLFSCGIATTTIGDRGQPLPVFQIEFRLLTSKPGIQAYRIGVLTNVDGDALPF